MDKIIEKALIRAGLPRNTRARVWHFLHDPLDDALRSAAQEDGLREAVKVLELVHDSVTVTQDHWRDHYYHIPKDVLREVDKALAHQSKKKGEG